MKAKAIYPKVATDLYWIQILWTLGFLGILLLIQIVKAFLPIGIEWEWEWHEQLF